MQPLQPSPLPPPPSVFLSDLPPDCWTGIATSWLSYADLANLGTTCSAMRAALDGNAGLWAALFSQQFPQPFATIQQQQQQQQLAASHPSGISPALALQSLSWRQSFLDAHDASRRLLSTPAWSSWCSDASPINFVQLHAAGTIQQLTIVSQAELVELRAAGTHRRSFQLFGHSGRVTAAVVAESQRKMGVISTSADQTLRLWSLPPSASQPEADEHFSNAIMLTPTRTLRGHSESITSLQASPPPPLPTHPPTNTATTTAHLPV